jgi:KaiC/GvpD/RAD55 family RecA-like ATPase
MATRPPAGRYALDDALPERRLDPVPGGTNLLVVGEDGSGALAFVSRALARAPTYGEVVILVATDRPTADLVAGYRSRLSDAEDLDHLYVVDASHSGLKRETGPLSPARIEAASSPADVTGIGVGVTNHLRSVRSDRVRLGVCSLSAVVDRLGPERAFAFAHVMTSRVRSADHLGLFVVDPTRHEPEHVRVLQSLVDGTLTFREADDGRRQVRGTGVVDVAGEWTDVRSDG